MHATPVSTLISEIEHSVFFGDTEVPIHHVAIDSREVQPGGLFVARKGEVTDGRKFISKALGNGASAMFVEEFECDFNELQRCVTESGKTCAIVLIRNVDLCLDAILKRFYGEDLRKVKLIGVTGTNGKTTTVELLASALAGAGARVGRICSSGIFYHDTCVRSGKRTATIPPIDELYRTIAHMGGEDVDYVILETSSSALASGRLDGLTFEIGVFTGLSRDHLSRHGTMQNYLAAKLRLLERSHVAIAHQLDPAASSVQEACAHTALVSDGGIRIGAALAATDILYSEIGITFGLSAGTAEASEKVTLPIFGRGGLTCALFALAAVSVLGLPLGSALQQLKTRTIIPARMEKIECGDCSIIYDCSHTEASLQNALTAIKLHFARLAEKGITAVFSLDKNRDPEGCLKIGEVLAEHCTSVILTHSGVDHAVGAKDDHLNRIADVLVRRGVNSEIISTRNIAIRAGIAKAQRRVLYVSGWDRSHQHLDGRLEVNGDYEVIRSTLENEPAR